MCSIPEVQYKIPDIKMVKSYCIIIIWGSMFTESKLENFLFSIYHLIRFLDHNYIAMIPRGHIQWCPISHLVVSMTDINHSVL